MDQEQKNQITSTKSDALRDENFCTQLEDSKPRIVGEIFKETRKCKLTRGKRLIQSSQYYENRRKTLAENKDSHVCILRQIFVNLKFMNK